MNKTFIRKFTLLAVFLAAVLVSLIYFIDPCEEHELFRERSPTRQYDAVVNQKNCGATTSFLYKISVELAGNNQKNKNILLEMDNVGEFSINWSAPASMTILYSDAQIWNFQNFKYFRHEDNTFTKIELELKKK